MLMNAHVDQPGHNKDSSFGAFSRSRTLPWRASQPVPSPLAVLDSGGDAATFQRGGVPKVIYQQNQKIKHWVLQKIAWTTASKPVLLELSACFVPFFSSWGKGGEDTASTKIAEDGRGQLVKRSRGMDIRNIKQVQYMFQTPNLRKCWSTSLSRLCASAVNSRVSAKRTAALRASAESCKSAWNFDARSFPIRKSARLHGLRCTFTGCRDLIIQGHWNISKSSKMKQWKSANVRHISPHNHHPPKKVQAEPVQSSQVASTFGCPWDRTMLCSKVCEAYLPIIMFI